MTAVPASSRVGADVGGTFTDIVVLHDGAKLERIKVLSTPQNYARAITASLAERLSASARRGVTGLVHGTTVATNAILQESKPSIGLVTTAGFRDVLELRRGRRPSLYDLDWTPPAPLVPRDLRFTVRERVGADGEVVAELSAADLARCVEDVRRSGVRAVAVCLLNSHQNAVHERLVADRLAAALPELRITCSSTIAPRAKEFERASTTVVNAFLLPLIDEYIADLVHALNEVEIAVRPEIMQSDGTTASAGLVGERPFLIIESGPAAGVVAAARLAHEMERSAVITFDMGGTTAKASLVEDHTVRLADELEVGDSLTRGAGLLRGSGYAVMSPCVDLTEVGSGGGSIAWLADGGLLRVGPRSAGSSPGPACYGLGGVQATVTDAHVALGYLNGDAIAGGSRSIDLARAVAAIAPLAEGLGLSIEDAAYGIYEVATAMMRRAIRAVSVERGHDPRDFSLIAFGGAGGLHAAALAAELEMLEVIVPIVSGLFSSLGLLFSDIAVTRGQSRFAALNADALQTQRADADRLAGEAARELAEHYGAGGPATVSSFLSLRYAGQSSTLTVPFTAQADAGLEVIAERFHAEHERVYGQSARGDEIEIVDLRVRVSLPAPAMRFSDLASQYVDEAGSATQGTRDMYFGPAVGTIPVPVLGRRDLSDRFVAGPIVLDEPDATILVPPGFRVRRDSTGSVLMSTAPIGAERT